MAELLGLGSHALRSSTVCQKLQVTDKLLPDFGDLPFVNGIPSYEEFARVFFDNRGQLFHAQCFRGDIHINFRQVVVDRLHLMNHGKLICEGYKRNQHQDQKSGNDLA